MNEINEKFCCKNKIFCGNTKDFKIYIFSYLIIICFPILYTLFVNIYIYENYGIFLFLTFYILVLIVFYNLLSTQFKDPGIIMKNQLKPLTYSILNEESDDKNKINDIELDKKPKEFENKLLDQETHLHTNENIKELDLEIYKQKICASCNIVRPPKAGHCWRCNNCVKGFDHHCYFVVCQTLLFLLL